MGAAQLSSPQWSMWAIGIQRYKIELPWGFIFKGRADQQRCQLLPRTLSAHIFLLCQDS